METSKSKVGPFIALAACLLTALAGIGWLLIPPLRFRSEQLPLPAPANLQGLDQAIARLDESLSAEVAPLNAALSRTTFNPTGTSAPTELLDWARRVSLGLCGAIPSLEEIRQLESQPEDQREAWWLDHLLADRRTADHLAERLARVWVGTENGPFILYRRRKFVSWLSDQLAANRPYDQIVRELLSSEGIWTDTPAVNFVTVTTDIDGTGQPSPIRLAARTSRAFLAMRIDCLECHDDFLGTIRLGDPGSERGGEQADFHRFAAFFSSAKNSLAGVRDRADAASYEFTLLDEDEPTPFEPAVPFSSALLPTSGGSRQRLAHWLTHAENRQFARASVNRFWAILFGQPLVSPLDDIPLTGELPAALDELADDFVRHDYDLQRLLRILAGSQSFHAATGPLTQPLSGPEQFAENFPALRLRPEQVAHSLIQSASFTTLDASAHVLRRLIGSAQELEFMNRYGDFGENEFDARSETVTQRLLLLNGELVREQLEQGYSSPTRLAALAPNPEKALEILFLVTLTRRPFQPEKIRLLPQLESAWKQDRAARLQDLYWALLNSSEFGTAR
jgi:hypothetical protein